MLVLGIFFSGQRKIGLEFLPGQIYRTIFVKGRAGVKVADSTGMASRQIVFRFAFVLASRGKLCYGLDPFKVSVWVITG